MKLHNKKISKLTAGLFLVSVIFSSLLPQFNQLNQAQAAVPTFETNPVINAGEAANETSLVQQLFEFAQRFVRSTLKRRLLDIVVDDIVLWIQGGGEPRFVSDWSGFLEEAANVAVGDFTREIGAGFLCSPFSLQVQLTLLPVKKFSQAVTCTLDDIVGNIQNFYNDFRNGGWLAFNQSLAPQNNYFGASILGAIELQKRIEAAQGAALNEAQAGAGFLSYKECAEASGPWPPGEEPPDQDRDGKKGDFNCRIITPGDTIANTISKAVGSDIDYLLTAEELEDYLSSIVNALINRFLTEGLAKVVPNTQIPPPSRIPSTSPCEDLSGSASQACLDYLNSIGTNFSLAKNTAQNIVNQNLALRRNGQAAINDSVARLQKYIADLQNLLSLFNGLTCAQKQNYTNQIQSELDFANAALPALLNQQSLNQALIDQLIEVKKDLEALNDKDADWEKLNAISKKISDANLSDLADAQQLKDNSESFNSKLISRVSRNLQTFNSYLNGCGSPSGLPGF